MRRALPEDMERILVLEREAPETSQWSEAVWQRIFAGETTGPRRAVFVAESCESVVGFIVGSCVGDVAELESVVVAQAERRQGLGKALCAQALMWAREQAADVIELEVRAGNAAAQALYRSLGFAEQRRRSRYYRDPVDDAVVMALPLR